jgi:hypothetical protein
MMGASRNIYWSPFMRKNINCLVCGRVRDVHGAKGMCSNCYQKSRYQAGKRSAWREKITGTCTVPGCSLPINHVGFKLKMCNRHALRMKRNGTTERMRQDHSGKTPEQRKELRRLLARKEYERNSESYKKRAAIWRSKNPAKAVMAGRKRQLALTRATPLWLTEAQWAEMNAIYDRAWSLVRSTGVKHEVDHIIPLRHKRASGLHIAMNLAIIPKTDNRRKSNDANLDEIASAHMQWLRDQRLA